MCDAKIRPFPDATELACNCDHAHGDSEHHATLRDYAYPGSATMITWFEDDRRNFRGDWVECVEPGCMLPGGHPRGHAS